MRRCRTGRGPARAVRITAPVEGHLLGRVHSVGPWGPAARPVLHRCGASGRPVRVRRTAEVGGHARLAAQPGHGRSRGDAAGESRAQARRLGRPRRTGRCRREDVATDAGAGARASGRSRVPRRVRCAGVPIHGRHVRRRAPAGSPGSAAAHAARTGGRAPARCSSSGAPSGRRPCRTGGTFVQRRRPGTPRRGGRGAADRERQLAAARR